MPPPPRSAPWWAAASMPRAIPLSTVTPAAARLGCRCRGGEQATRGRPARTDHGHAGAPVAAAAGNHRAGGRSSRCSSRSGQPGDHASSRRRGAAGGHGGAPRRENAAPRPRPPPPPRPRRGGRRWCEPRAARGRSHARSAAFAPRRGRAGGWPGGRRGGCCSSLPSSAALRVRREPGPGCDAIEWREPSPPAHAPPTRLPGRTSNRSPKRCRGTSMTRSMRSRMGPLRRLAYSPRARVCSDSRSRPRGGRTGMDWRRRRGRSPRGRARRRGTYDADLALLERLAQGFEVTARELADLVEEEDPVVSQADLTGARQPAATTHQAGARHGVMGCTEGRAGRGRRALSQCAAQGVESGHLQRLLVVEVGEQRAEGSRQHGLSAPRRPHHQEVVATGGGNLEGALGLALTAHVGRSAASSAAVALPAFAAGRARCRRGGQHSVAARNADHRERSTRAASAAFSSATARWRTPAARRQRAIGSTPVTGRTEPSSASSPMNLCPRAAARCSRGRGWPWRWRGRSRCPPWVPPPGPG